MEYPIIHKGKTVGTAAVIQQGMTFLIRCSCWDPETRDQIVYVGEHPLGRCLPEGKAYSLVRRIPKRDLPAEPCFEIVQEKQKKHITVQENAPVEGIELLRGARLTSADGKPVLVLIVSDQMSSSSATGQ